MAEPGRGRSGAARRGRGLAVFRPWTEENWFKSSWIEFALDALVDDSVELDDQEHLAVNPVEDTGSPSGLCASPLAIQSLCQPLSAMSPDSPKRSTASASLSNPLYRVMAKTKTARGMSGYLNCFTKYSGDIA
jgi:hypothetical protein